MSTKAAAARLMEASSKLDQFAVELRDVFRVVGEDYVEPLESNDMLLDIAARYDRGAAISRLWPIIADLHYALKELEFRENTNLLNDQIIGEWTKLSEAQWDAPSAVKGAAQCSATCKWVAAQSIREGTCRSLSRASLEVGLRKRRRRCATMRNIC
jgi:hypothetical protein